MRTGVVEDPDDQGFNHHLEERAPLAEARVAAAREERRWRSRFGSGPGGGRVVVSAGWRVRHRAEAEAAVSRKIAVVAHGAVAESGTGQEAPTEENAERGTHPEAQAEKLAAGR